MMTDNKMEYSCYYFHSNRNTEITIFVRSGDMFKIKFETFDPFDEEEEVIGYDFIISYDEMKNMKSLYVCYLLSKLLTKDINKLEYFENSYNKGWAITAKKNWKGLYFTEYYDNECYLFEDIPEVPLIFDYNTNNKKKEYCNNYFNDNNKLFERNISYLNKYINNEYEKIDKELNTIEHYVKKDKITEMFSSRIKHFINEDTYKVILSKTLK